MNPPLSITLFITFLYLAFVGAVVAFAVSTDASRCERTASHATCVTSTW